MCVFFQGLQEVLPGVLGVRDAPEVVPRGQPALEVQAVRRHRLQGAGQTQVPLQEGPRQTGQGATFHLP